MTVDELNETAANIYAELRRSTSVPREGVSILTMVLYLIWRESNAATPYHLPDFCTDITAALYDLHSLNQEGTKQ
jgi:hypothetical protein